mmetsp:Transcript_113387/g.293562  ORF Transcript_113387/g.293562 Transcript_113387/m.293562 type:complete len:94 (-) Transcript_113387:48-329(-)
MLRTELNQPNSYHEFNKWPSMLSNDVRILCMSASSRSCRFSAEYVPQKCAPTSTHALFNAAVTSRVFVRAFLKAKTGVGKKLQNTAMQHARQA